MTGSSIILELWTHLKYSRSIANNLLLGKGGERAVAQLAGTEGEKCKARGGCSGAVWTHWSCGALCWGRSWKFLQVLEVSLWDVYVSIASVFSQIRWNCWWKVRLSEMTMILWFREVHESSRGHAAIFTFSSSGKEGINVFIVLHAVSLKGSAVSQGCFAFYCNGSNSKACLIRSFLMVLEVSLEDQHG